MPAITRFFALVTVATVATGCAAFPSFEVRVGHPGLESRRAPANYNAGPATYAPGQRTYPASTPAPQTPCGQTPAWAPGPYPYSAAQYQHASAH